jgi:NAD(P)-dependent dehydrogenase (short-subunit alcohol dehydrogenase family)
MRIRIRIPTAECENLTPTPTPQAIAGTPQLPRCPHGTTTAEARNSGSNSLAAAAAPATAAAAAAAAVAGAPVSVPQLHVESMELDLGRLSSVRKFAEDWRRRGLPLHLLVCNAGVMGPPRRLETADGIEMQFQVG